MGMARKRLDLNRYRTPRAVDAEGDGITLTDFRNIPQPCPRNFRTPWEIALAGRKLAESADLSRIVAGDDDLKRNLPDPLLHEAGQSGRTCSRPDQQRFRRPLDQIQRIVGAIPDEIKLAF